MASKNGLSNSDKLVGSLKNLSDAGRVMVSEGGGKLIGRGTGVAGKAAGAAGSGFTGVMFRVTEAVKNTATRFPAITLLVAAFAGIKMFQHFRNKKYANMQVAEHAQATQAMETLATVSPEQVAAVQQAMAMGIDPAQMAQLAQMQQGAQMGGVPPMGPAGQTDWRGFVTNQRLNGPQAGAGRGNG